MAVYLDHNATTPLHEKAFEAMQPYMQSVCGNASSLHRFGRLQRGAVEQAREQVAKLVGAHSDQVIFTSGGTESNNLLLKGLIKGLGASSQGKRIAVSAVEHMSLLEPALAMASDDCEVADVEIDLIEVDENGRVAEAALLNAINPDTVLVSVMAANNETGVIQDIETLAGITRDVAGDNAIWFHTDASQAAGKIAISFANSGVHAMTLSAHKLYGPMGVGALIIDKRLPLHAMLQGGSQEKALRAGTENVPAIVGFGAAAELANAELEQRAAHVKTLRDALQDRLQPLSGVEVFAQHAQRLPNTLQFGVQGFDGETLLMQLDRKGFAVSSGSACTSGKAEPSHVLKAMGVATELATSAVRVSFGKDNVMANVDDFIAALTEIIEIKQSAVMMAAGL